MTNFSPEHRRSNFGRARITTVLSATAFALFIGAAGCDVDLSDEEYGQTQQRICGDGAIDGADMCDDGNTISGDGCSATCGVEPGFVCNQQAALNIANPSFEANNMCAEATTTVNGWTVSPGSDVDIVANNSAAAPCYNYQCPDGVFCIDLSGSALASGISQDLTTVANQQYTLVWRQAGNCNINTTAPCPRTVDAKAFDQSNLVTPFATQAVSTTANGFGTNNWDVRSFTFTAQSTSTRIQFDSTSNSAFGPMMDSIVVAQSVCSPDTDGDGVADILDLDEDNDGITDADEYGGTDYSLDSNGNGVSDYEDPLLTGCVDVAPPLGTCDTLSVLVDPDGDQIPNHLDLDSDGDLIPDNLEAQATGGYVAPANAFNSDGIDTAYGNGIAVTNSDIADLPDFLDTDSDNDPPNDMAESGLTANNADNDNDGLDDGVDSNDSALGPVNAGLNLTSLTDANNNNIPDFREAVPVGCQNDGQCNLPLPACETVSMMCVQCNATENSLCVGLNPVCDLGTNTCAGCAADADCPGATSPACQPTGACGECSATNATLCGVGEVCDTAAGLCVPQPGCTMDSDCVAPLPACDVPNAVCVQCTTTNDFACDGDTPVCNTNTNQCAGCGGDADCTADATAPACQPGGSCGECSAQNAALCDAGEICNVATGVCITNPGCTMDSECTDPALPACENNTCNECSATNDTACGDDEVCENNVCVSAGGCTMDSECTDPAQPACQPNGTCGECSNGNTALCTADEVCNTTNGVCVPSGTGGAGSTSTGGEGGNGATPLFQGDGLSCSASAATGHGRDNAIWFALGVLGLAGAARRRRRA